MIKLWRDRINFLRYDSWSDDDLQDVSVFLRRFLPYARHYNDLSNEELEVLIRDARDCRWQVIDLSNCGLKTLPDSIGSLEDVRVLDLSNASTDGNSIKGQKNVFTTIPESLCHLSNIQRLNLHNTPITSLPNSIGNLASLKSLDLSNTRISTLPNSLGKLRNLKSLYLNNCQLKDIPYSVVQLGLPFVMNDENAHNCVNLHGVTLKEGDLSLFTRSREFIEEYYRNRISVEDTVQECKVIFLGDGAAGKSSLIERIIHDKFEEKLPTDGIKMTKWTRWPNGKTLELDGKPLILRFLDFGGQEIMHSMHRCFLTSHTIYVIVCEGRDDAEIDSVTARWIETVRSFAPSCPVILALNKADLNHHVTVNERALKEINSDFRYTLHTSAKIDGDPGVQQLVKCILQEVPDCISKMNGNRKFLDLKNELEGMEEDYIFPEQFRERCNQLNIKEKVRDGLLGWFQDLGVAYTYTTTFREVYVLKPSWLTNGIYRLIIRTGDGGFLRHSTIRDTLESKYSGDADPYKTYTPQEMAFILHVMRKFEISLCLSSPFESDDIEMIPESVKLNVG